MALANYTELETALTLWVQSRGDVAAIIPEVVRLAEANFNMKLRTLDMITSTDITLTSGVGTLPSDYLGVVSVIEKSTPRRVLEYYSMEALENQFDTSVSGLGCGYTLYGSSIQVAPQATNDIEFRYYQEIPNLESNSTNWLMTKHPSLYLEACQMEIFKYHNMVEDLQITAQRVQAQIRDINNSEDLGTLGNASPSRTNLGPIF